MVESSKNKVISILTNPNELNKNDLKIEKLNSEIINLKDELSLLESELKNKNHNDVSKEDQIGEIANQIEILNQSILSIYDE